MEGSTADITFDGRLRLGTVKTGLLQHWMFLGRRGSLMTNIPTKSRKLAAERSVVDQGVLKLWHGRNKDKEAANVKLR